MPLMTDLYMSEWLHASNVSRTRAVGYLRLQRQANGEWPVTAATILSVVYGAPSAEVRAMLRAHHFDPYEDLLVVNSSVNPPVPCLL